MWIFGKQRNNVNENNLYPDLLLQFFFSVAEKDSKEMAKKCFIFHLPLQKGDQQLTNFVDELLNWIKNYHKMLFQIQTPPNNLKLDVVFRSPTTVVTKILILLQ